MSRNDNSSLLFGAETLEPRCLLSAVGFISHEIISNQPFSGFLIDVVDVDGDGDVDLLSGTQNGAGIVWYENTDGMGSFTPQRQISGDNIRSIRGTDLDGDGDVDIITANQFVGSRFQPHIVWYGNTEGSFDGRSYRAIADQSAAVDRAITADLDGDGDADVLAASFEGTIAWQENLDSRGTFGEQRVITTETNFTQELLAADFDGDGDLDVLSASSQDNKVAWYENTDGLGAFGPQRVLTTAALSARSVYATDIDGDGDLDVLSASWRDDKIAWYENVDGRGSFGPQQEISTRTDGATSVYAADLDGDGDVDVLSSSAIWTPEPGREGLHRSSVAWYENTDGQGNFRARIVAARTGETSQVHAADVDGDGDIDVLSAADDGIAWYENRLIGDTNDDGVVDFADFLGLSANFGKAADAVWEDGDFDASGTVDFNDFLLLTENFGAANQA